MFKWYKYNYLKWNHKTYLRKKLKKKTVWKAPPLKKEIPIFSKVFHMYEKVGENKIFVSKCAKNFKKLIQQSKIFLHVIDDKKIARFWKSL